MKLKSFFFIVFCLFLNGYLTMFGAGRSIDMCVPMPHLLETGSSDHVTVRVSNVSNEHGPRSKFFAVFRGEGEYDIDKDYLGASPYVTWGIQDGFSFHRLFPDDSRLHSCKLQAFAVCQYVGTIWEDYCDTLLRSYDDRKQSPVYKEQLSIARRSALASPVQIVCSHSCYDDGCSFNAYYTRDYNGLGKAIFLPRYATSCGAHHTTGSFFTVAHEAGHSILDRFCPTYQDRIEKLGERIDTFLKQQGFTEGDIDSRLREFSKRSPEILKVPVIVTYLSCRTLHEAFGDITGVLGSLRVAQHVGNDMTAFLARLKPESMCYLDVECQGCERGASSDTSDPLNYHNRSLLLTREFCNLIKRENDRLRDGMSAIQAASLQFLDLVLLNKNKADTFDQIILGLRA